MVPDIFLEVDAYLEESDFIGELAEVTPPKWVFTTYEYMANGMLAPKDINNFKMEKMETEWTLGSKSAKAFSHLDIRPGQTKLFTLKSATTDDNGTLHAWVHKMEINFSNLDFGTLKIGEASETKLKGTVQHYELHRDNEEIARITVGPPATCIIGGTDMLADFNAAMGRV